MIYGTQALNPFKYDPALTANQRIIAGGATTIATTGNTDIVVLVPFLAAGVKWTLLNAEFFTGAQGLAANDTNYLTFTLTNKSNSDAVMLGTETTQLTGGTGLVTAHTVRSFTLSTTAASLIVDTDDVLLFRAAATGTLGATMPNSGIALTFGAYNHSRYQ